MSKITGQNLIDVIKNKSKNLEGEMSFFEHLEVLRWHLIRSAIAVVLFMGVAWSYFDVIFDKVIMGPKNLDFWTYRMICSLGQRFNLGDDLCIDEIPIQIINIQMAGQFTLQMNA
ncbi:MAG TPA: twin-arginine translocase subunit TatC, partial [Sphingobacteriaceae bacterium]|nr:twin-arginine translocase subunit TatC [Sphingobacteriaceae bacterium]